MNVVYGFHSYFAYFFHNFLFFTASHPIADAFELRSGLLKYYECSFLFLFLFVFSLIHVDLHTFICMCVILNSSNTEEKQDKNRTRNFLFRIVHMSYDYE